MKMVVKESWPDLGYMPDTTVAFAISGWQSVAELQKGLKQRFTHRKVEKITNGVTYEGNFQGNRRVFEVTLVST